MDIAGAASYPFGDFYRETGIFGSLIQVKIKDCTSATLIGEIANTQ